MYKAQAEKHRAVAYITDETPSHQRQAVFGDFFMGRFMQQGEEVEGIYKRLNIALMMIWGIFSLIMGFNLESIYYVISFSSPIWVCLGIRWILGKPYLPSWAVLLFITIQVVFLILITTNANRYDDLDTPALIIFLTIPVFYFFRFLSNRAYGFNSLNNDLSFFKKIFKKVFSTLKNNKKNIVYLILMFLFISIGVNNLNSSNREDNLGLEKSFQFIDNMANGGKTFSSMDEQELKNIYDNIGDDVTLGESALRQSIIEAVKTNPNRAARALGYSNQYQIPLEMTGHDHETLEGDDKWHKIDFKKINQYDPKLAEFLRDKENAILIPDDIDADNNYDYMVSKLFSGEYKKFGLTLIVGILITWGIGFLPPLMIRFLILKRPVSKKSAIIISSIFCVLNITFFVLLNERGESGPHSVQGLIALASYYILRKGSKNKDTSEQKLQKRLPYLHMQK